MSAELLSFLLALSGVAGAGVWRAATLASRLSEVGKKAHEGVNLAMRVEQQQKEADEMIVRLDERGRSHDANVARIEAKLEAIDEKLNRLLTRTPVPR